MWIPSFLINFLKGMKSLPDTHPLKVKFEQALNEYCLERWGRPVIRDPQEEVNPAEATIQELRNAAETLILESHRLESLKDVKHLYAIRKLGRKDLLFIDKEEKEVRFWALENPSDENRMYEEWWAPDPLKEGKPRCVKRVPMDIPTITARNQVAEEQKRSQKNQV